MARRFQLAAIRGGEKGFLPFLVCSTFLEGNNLAGFSIIAFFEFGLIFAYNLLISVCGGRFSHNERFPPQPSSLTYSTSIGEMVRLINDRYKGGE